jgi:quinol monooxygenase YgiN
MPCFKNLVTLEREIRDRISGKFNTGTDKKNELIELVERLISQSLNNNTTKLYDQYQKMTNGIEP